METHHIYSLPKLLKIEDADAAMAALGRYFPEECARQRQTTPFAETPQSQRFGSETRRTPPPIHEAGSRIRQGQPWSKAISEFLNTFDAADTRAARIAMLAQAPPPSGDARLDALPGGIAEYLYKHWTLEDPPGWMSEPARYLAQPWFVTDSTDRGLVEYLTFASPPEFKSRNIMTDDRPPRRANSRSTVQGGEMAPIKPPGTAGHEVLGPPSPARGEGEHAAMTVWLNP